MWIILYSIYWFYVERQMLNWQKRQIKQKKKIKTKKTEIINPMVFKISNGKTMLLSKCAICGNKKLRFIKEQVV